MPTITEIVQEVVEEMCDKYCRMPAKYVMEINDVDEAQETMINEVCKDCPLNKLI